MSSSFLLGLVGPALQLALLVILARRRLYRRFPFFFLCMAYCLPVTIARLCVMNRPVTFFVLYWVTEMIYGMLALLAIHEVFRGVLETYSSLHHWLRWLPLLALAGVVGNSVWQTIYHPIGRGGRLGGLAAGAYAFVAGVLLLQAIVFLICVRLAFRRNSPMKWGQYSAGILTGFGIAAVATLVIYVARFRLGPGLELVFRYMPPVAYTVAALTWLRAFYREEPPIRKAATDPELYRRARKFMSTALEGMRKELRLRFGPVH